MTINGCRWCGEPHEGHGTRYHHRAGLHQWQSGGWWDTSMFVVQQTRDDTTTPGSNTPTPTRLNRATRRAQARANRQKGRRR